MDPVCTKMNLPSSQEEALNCHGFQSLNPPQHWPKSNLIRVRVRVRVFKHVVEGKHVNCNNSFFLDSNNDSAP